MYVCHVCTYVCMSCYVILCYACMHVCMYVCMYVYQCNVSGVDCVFLVCIETCGDEDNVWLELHQTREDIISKLTYIEILLHTCLEKGRI